VPPELSPKPPHEEEPATIFLGRFSFDAAPVLSEEPTTASLKAAESPKILSHDFASESATLCFPSQTRFVCSSPLGRGLALPLARAHDESDECA